MLIGIDSSPCSLSLRNRSTLCSTTKCHQNKSDLKNVFVQKSFFFNIFCYFNPNHAYWNQRRLFSCNLPGMFGIDSSPCSLSLRNRSTLCSTLKCHQNKSDLKNVFVQKSFFFQYLLFFQYQLCSLESTAAIFRQSAGYVCIILPEDFVHVTSEFLLLTS